VNRASRFGSAGHGAQTLLSQAARDQLVAPLSTGATLRCRHALRSFVYSSIVE